MALRARLVPLCRLFPPFSLGEGLQQLLLCAAGVGLRPAENLRFALPPGAHLLAWPRLGQPLAALAAQAAAYALLAAVAEARGAGCSLPACLRRHAPGAAPRQAGCGDDDGVAAERSRLQAAPDGDVVAALGASKRYRRQQAAAVDAVWLGVHPGERLALLGANGAGKSTLLALLGGAAAPSGGAVRHGAAAARGGPGVCPQHNPLLPLLTAAEQLRLHARLRGVPEPHVRAAAEAAAAAVRLADDGCPAAALSGGAQRKLSLALACTGDPPLLLCDEPSSGLDASSRRAMWAALCARPVRAWFPAPPQWAPSCADAPARAGVHRRGADDALGARGCGGVHARRGHGIGPPACAGHARRAAAALRRRPHATRGAAAGRGGGAGGACAVARTGRGARHVRR
jgi:ATP-binding cassette subfamily A (ABC1) protein 4